MFRPKLTLFAFEKVRLVRFADVVPAEMLIGPDAVMTDAPFNPKLRLFEFENVTADKFKLVVPAEMLMSVIAAAPATEAVSVEPFKPKVTPLALLKVIAERLLDVVPAETLMFVSTPTGGVVLPVPVTVPSGGQ